jgi:NADPH:quinone reductase
MKSPSFEEELARTNRFGNRWLAAFATGQVTPVLEGTFRLAQAADAHRYQEASGNIGMIVVSMD